MNRPGVVIALADQNVSVEWKDLLFSLGDAAIATALSVPTGGLSLATLAKTALDGLKAIRVTESIESRALALIVLSMALSFDKVLAHGNAISDEKTTAAKMLYSIVRKKVEERSYIMSKDVFINPSNSELYQDIREDCAAIVANLLPNSTMIVEECAAKLDAAFNYSLFSVMQMRREYFAPLEEALENPGFAVAQLEFDWVRYGASLIEKFTVNPVFGQKEYSVALSQVYVPLGGRWKSSSDDYQETVCQNLDDELDAWALDGSPGDAVRLIFGGPGSGKSSLAKSMASRLAGKPEVRPILIELQHTNALGDLRQAIEQRLVQEGEWFQSDPLAQRDDNRPFIIIFDGLDELVVPGTAAASRVADGFVVALKSLLRNLNSQNKIRARAVVTGRSAIMHSFAKAYDVAPKAAIEVMGFLYKHYENGERAILDRRPEWWEKFAKAYGHSPNIPKHYSTKSLMI